MIRLAVPCQWRPLSSNVNVFGVTQPRAMSPRRIFVSYARTDARKVHVLVRLLRTTGAPIFLDVDSIALGSKWRARISEAIGVSDAVLVFWSKAASESSEVRVEYEMAISLERDVIPVALDATSFPPALAQLNGLSLVDFFVPHDPSFSPHSSLEPLLARLQGRPRVARSDDA